MSKDVCYSLHCTPCRFSWVVVCLKNGKLFLNDPLVKAIIYEAYLEVFGEKKEENKMNNEKVKEERL